MSWSSFEAVSSIAQPAGIALAVNKNKLMDSILFVSSLKTRLIYKITATSNNCNGASICVNTSVFAGNEITKSPQDGKGLNAVFNKPYNLAVDSLSNIYVSDNTRIRKITKDTDVTTLYNSETVSSTFTGIHYFYGLAIDLQSNTLYMSGFDVTNLNYLIQRSSLGGSSLIMSVNSNLYASPYGALAFMPGRSFLFEGGNKCGLNEYNVGSGTNNWVQNPVGPYLSNSDPTKDCGDVDGIGSNAKFGAMYGLSVLEKDIIFAADGNNKIRKIDLTTSRVSTVLDNINGCEGLFGIVSIYDGSKDIVLATCQSSNQVLVVYSTSTRAPTSIPTLKPSFKPSVSPSVEATRAPSVSPSVESTRAPSVSPSVESTRAPSVSPSVESTRAPSVSPSVLENPSSTFNPSNQISQTHESSSSGSTSLIVALVVGILVLCACVIGFFVRRQYLKEKKSNETLREWQQNDGGGQVIVADWLSQQWNAEDRKNSQFSSQSNVSGKNVQMIDLDVVENTTNPVHFKSNQI